MAKELSTDEKIFISLLDTGTRTRKRCSNENQFWYAKMQNALLNGLPEWATSIADLDRRDEWLTMIINSIK
jgi:hypothetical protein